MFLDNICFFYLKKAGGDDDNDEITNVDLLVFDDCNEISEFEGVINKFYGIPPPS